MIMSLHSTAVDQLSWYRVVCPAVDKYDVTRDITSPQKVDPTALTQGRRSCNPLRDHLAEPGIGDSSR